MIAQCFVRKFIVETFYIYSETTGKEQYDHPEFLKIIETLKAYDGIKYSAYRVAFKSFALQKELKGRYSVFLFIYSETGSKSLAGVNSSSS